LGISKTAARVRLHRARKRLAAEVANSEVAQPEVAKTEVAKPEFVAFEVAKSTLHVTEISPVVARSNSVSINNALNTPPSTSGKTPERTNHEIS
jgi:hypothetical protein